MATITLDKPEAIRAKVAEQVADTTAAAENLANEARRLKTRALDAFEEGKYAARRTIRQGMRQYEAIKDETVHRVRKAPLMAVGVTFGVGLLLGVAIGWMGHRPTRQ